MSCIWEKERWMGGGNQAMEGLVSSVNRECEELSK
jgi:hypothetical protein